MQLFRFTCDWIDRLQAKKRGPEGDVLGGEALLGLRGRVVDPAEAAFDHLKNTNCSDALYMSDRDCEYIRTLDASDVNVYLAGPVDTRELRVVVPDDNLDDDDSHNGVLVLDPYPQANFGHLVVIFYIDYAIDREWCYQQRGIVGEQIIHPLATFQ